MPLGLYESWKQRRKNFIALFTHFQEATGGADPEEVMQQVIGAQQEVCRQS
jgi:hypothetical protein